MQFNSKTFSLEITKCFQIIGSIANDNDVIFITQIMAEDCQQYKNLDFNELLDIINLGSRGKFGDFFGLNVATIHKWIEFYLKSDYKKKYDKTKFIQRDELPELTQSAKDEIFKNSIIATLRSENVFEASLPIMYDYLVKNGYVDAKEGAILYLDQAKGKLATDLEKEKLKAGMELDAKKSKEIGKKIESILTGETDKNDVRFIAKVLFMKNIDLKELENKLK